MFWLIETQEQFDKVQFELGPEIFVLPIQRHPEMHPGIYAPLCLYLRDVTQPKGFLVNYFHPEALQFDPLHHKELVLQIRIHAMVRIWCYLHNLKT
jgi:hypothetical protein